MQSINPATGEILESHREVADKEVEERVQRAHDTFLSWRRLKVRERTELLHEVAELLEARADEYAELMAKEMGKPVVQGRAEIEKCAWACTYYGDYAEHFLAPMPVETDALKSLVAFEPLGVVLAVMPWNFPFWQLFRFAAPALAAGNTVVLKHASNVPGCALAIQEVLHDAGFPRGALEALVIDHERAQALIDDPRIAAVTVTGSPRAGRAIASRAGAALKKCVLELGGSDPYVVLEDADLDVAVECCVKARLVNSGQSCIAGKRFIAVDRVYDDFEAMFVERMALAVVGDPLLDDTEVGPLAREDLRDKVREQVERSVDLGAEVLLGGAVPDEPGAWYPPTVLREVKPGMPAYHEEVFGPVAALIRARDQEDALRIANDSAFGLGAAVFTENRARGEEIAKKHLEAGCCFVNTNVRSDPRLPFGGIKESGYGRELSSFGIRELVNVKTVYVA